jgi:hypothetical protein
MTAKAKPVPYPKNLIEQAKCLFPNNPEIHEALSAGKGIEVARLICDVIGPGYAPDPAEVVRLIRIAQPNKVADEATKYRDWGRFYSSWADFLNTHYSQKPA